jgi:hypothetical protein
MEIKANSYKLSPSEKAILKRLIDKRYGKITTPVDYESLGDYDTGVEADVYAKTGKTLSGSTLERLVGLRNEGRGVRKSTLEIISQYLDRQNIDHLLSSIANISRNGLKETVQFSYSDLFKKHTLVIKYGEDKELYLKYSIGDKFQVISSKNGIFKIGDIVKMQQLEVGRELVFSSSERTVKNKKVNIGTYYSGSTNLVRQIVFLEKV